MKSKTLNASSRALHGAARFTAPICKFALSLCAALGIASVTQAADNVWEGDDDGYWSTDANWTNPSGDYWVINGNATSKAVKFNSNPTLGYTLAIVTDGVTFSGDDASDGLVQTAGDVRLGAWANGALTISSGTHVLNELAVSSAWWDNTGPVDGTLTVSGGNLTVNTTTWVGSGQSANAAGSDGVINVSGGSVTFIGTPTLGCVAGATGTLNINAGIATASTIVQGGGAGYVNFNGGTLAAAAAGTLIGDGLTVALNAAGGTIATDYDVTVAPAMTGAGSLTKTGSGVLILSTMPTFSGTITVALDAGSVILPAGATIAAGTYTASRTVESGVEYYSNPPLTITQADIVGDSIVLTADTTLNVTENANFENLSVSGPYTLTLSGSSAITATSLNIAAGTTVQLASGTTLADGRIVTTSVTGAGVIGYTGVNPDSSVGYDNSAAWTGTVWIQGLTGLVDWNPTAFGNSASTLRLSGVAGYFVKAQLSLPFAIELENDIYSYGIDLTNGYSFNSTGGWCYVKVPTLKGSGTYKTSGGGGNLFVVTDDWSGFTGSFNLANKTVWLGYGTPAAEVDYTPGTVAGGIRIAAGKSVNWSTSWTLSKFFGEGTIKMAAPWDATPAFAGYVGDSTLWTGTVELAACVNEGTGSVAVYPGRMGNANSRIVFKGLASGATKGYYFNGSTSAMVQLDGDVTISDGTSGATYSLGVLTGIGSFTGATSLGTACTFAFSAVSNYTGTISANSKSLVTIGTYMSDADVAVGTKLVSVDSDNAYVTLNSVTVTGGEPQKVATAAQSGDDGFGVYVTACQRDVYWVGGTSGNWSDTTAWALADGTPLNAYPSDYTQNAGDNVIFTNNAVVVADCRPVITKMTLNADVTLSTTDAFVANTYAGKKYLFVETVEGEGTLTLSNAVIAAIGNGRPFKIYTPVCVADGTRNSFGCSTFVNYLYGDLSGSGYLEVRNGNYGGLYLYGDNSEFSGEFDSSETTRCTSAFYAGNATSSKAIWKLRGTDQDINRVAFITDSSTYYFGALLEGSLLQSVYNNPTLEVGARDEVASVADLRGRGVDSKNNKYYFNITKVGTNVFTVVNGNSTYKNNIGNVLIEGGTLALPGVPNYATYITFAGEGATLQPTAEGLDFSALIKNSSTPICFDDNGEDFTWATQLASSNIGGLTKKGVGTLTLTAVPQYSGPTVVEAGKLVVPAGTQLESVSGAGTLVIDLADTADTGILFSVASKAEETTIDVRNVPASATRLDTANGVIYYSGTPQTYYWNPTGDSRNWGLVDNWLVGGSIPSGLPTLIDTVEFSAGASVVIDAAASALMLNGSGDLTITANSDLAIAGDAVVGGVLTKWGMASVNVKGSLTASSVAVGTGAVTAFSGSAPTELTLDSGSTSAYAIDDEASALGYGAKYAVAQAGSLLLEGSGQIIANGDQTVDVESAATTNTFTGFMYGNMSLSKTGAGTLALFGNNTFTGDFAIEEGTVKLNTPLDIDGIRYDFDSSDDSWFSYDGNGALRWQDAAHPENVKAFSWNDSTNPTFVENNSSIFNGRKVLYSDSFRMVEPDASNSAGNPKTAFFVVQNTDGGHANIAGDRNDERGNIRWRNNGFMVGFGTGGSTSWNSNGIWGNGTLATQGDNGGYNPGSNPTVLTFVNDCANIYKCWFDTRTTRQMYFGGSGKQAWAEYLSYTRELSFDEKAAVEQYLMAKWGINNMEYTVLPKTAAVTMAPGTTLDMGGLTQTVKSFTGAGTVANGYLKTTGDFTVAGDLTVQATEGQEYTLAQNGSQTLTMTGDAKGYVLKVPDGAKEVCRVVVPDGLTYGFEGKGTFDVTVVNAPARWVISAKDVSGGKRLRIGGPGFYLNVR